MLLVIQPASPLPLNYKLLMMLRRKVNGSLSDLTLIEDDPITSLGFEGLEFNAGGRGVFTETEQTLPIPLANFPNSILAPLNSPMEKLSPLGGITVSQKFKALNSIPLVAISVRVY